MTHYHQRHGMSTCVCGHDLIVPSLPNGDKHQGHLFCSSRKCKHSAEKKLKKPVPRSSTPYQGPKSAA